MQTDEITLNKTIQKVVAFTQFLEENWDEQIEIALIFSTITCEEMAIPHWEIRIKGLTR